jgi:hypothetical protein
MNAIRELRWLPILAVTLVVAALAYTIIRQDWEILGVVLVLSGLTLASLAGREIL